MTDRVTKCYGLACRPGIVLCSVSSKLFYSAKKQLGWLNPPHSDAIQPRQGPPNTIWWRIRKISLWQKRLWRKILGEKDEIWDQNGSVRGGNVDYGRYPAVSLRICIHQQAVAGRIGRRPHLRHIYTSTESYSGVRATRTLCMVYCNYRPTTSTCISYSL